MAAAAAATDAMDTVIPKIDRVTADDIETQFVVPTLTPIDGKPNYPVLFEMRNECSRNARAVESDFGGGNHGNWGIVADDDVYHAETGEHFNVPAVAATPPAFPDGATPEEKRKIVMDWQREQYFVRVAKMVEKLIKKQIIKSVDKRYLMEIYHTTFGLDNKTVIEIFKHLFKKYGKLKDPVIRQNRKDFEAPPDFSEAIDLYYFRQQKCQQLAKDAKEPISEAEMVRVLAAHVGATGMCNEKYKEFTCITDPDKRKWKAAKDFFREALEDAEDVIEITGAEAGLTANSMTSGTDRAQELVHQEINQQLTGHFDNLALAAAEQKEDFTSLTASVERLSK